jgi:hypothetical protein
MNEVHETTNGFVLVLVIVLIESKTDFLSASTLLFCGSNRRVRYKRFQSCKESDGVIAFFSSSHMLNI